MSIRYAVPLVIAAVVAFACGPRSHSSETSSRTPRRATTGVVSSAAVHVGRDVQFALQLRNEGTRRVEIHFPNGLTHDVAVLDAAGREVWRWSAGRMFTQSLQNRVLGASDSLQFAESWLPARAPAGRYTAVVTLKSANYPLEERVDFTLPWTIVVRRT